MPVAIQSLALFTPIVASNAIFSARRATRGVDSITENPIYGAMNMDIAAGQTLKGCKAAKDMAMVANGDARIMTEGASEIIKGLQSNKFLNGVGKIVGFTANNINPIICATSGAKVIFGSEDKLDATAKEVVALSAMFGAEKLAKTLVGMPYTEEVNGNTVTVSREGLYTKNLFLKSQAEAFNDYCSTKKMFNKVSLKFLPGTLKGLFFVCASILGYKVGTGLANNLVGTKEETPKQ